MSLNAVYQLLEKAQDQLRELDPAAYPPPQHELVAKLREQVDAAVELAFAAGNEGEPQG